MRGQWIILGAGCLLLNGCAGLGAMNLSMPSLFGYPGPTLAMQEASPGDYMQRMGPVHSKGFHPIELCQVINTPKTPGTPGTLCE